MAWFVTFPKILMNTPPRSVESPMPMERIIAVWVAVTSMSQSVMKLWPNAVTPIMPTQDQKETALKKVNREIEPASRLTAGARQRPHALMTIARTSLVPMRRERVQPPHAPIAMDQVKRRGVVLRTTHDPVIRHGIVATAPMVL